MITAPFSVILPFYAGDQAAHLSDAIESLAQQSICAQEIVLIQDGPVGEELNSCVQKWQEKLPEIKLVSLPKNLGLSGALNAGIDTAKNEWLARMDADDICLPDRFEKQWNLIQAQPDLALIGSWIEEYDEEMKEATAVRRLPENHLEILSYARWRCPFNHMTVMYRKSALLKLGKYKNFGAVGDDYELWARFLTAGYKTANLQESLVKARAGHAMFSARRRGMKYLKNEIKEINELYELGLLKPWHYAFHFTVKSIVRLSPPALVKLFYRGIRMTS